MKWCLSNMAVDIDKNGNIQPCKTNNQRRRIDLGAALLNAYTILKSRHEAEYKILFKRGWKMWDYLNQK